MRRRLTMATTLTSKGPVTVLKQIRNVLTTGYLLP